MTRPVDATPISSMFAPPPPTSSGKKRPSDFGDKVLRFEGASESTERKALATVCEVHGPIAFIDFSYGSTSGYIRFKTADGAQAALFAFKAAPPELSGTTPRWRLLSTDEAEAYSNAVKEKRREGDARKKEGSEARSGARGVMLSFDGVLPHTERRTLQALCETHGPVAFVDFRFGETSGYVRFKSADGAQAAHAAFASFAPTVAGPTPSSADQPADATPTWRLLSQEEEDTYYESVQSKKRHGRDGMATGSLATTASQPYEPSNLPPSCVVKVCASHCAGTALAQHWHCTGTALALPLALRWHCPWRCAGTVPGTPLAPHWHRTALRRPV